MLTFVKLGMYSVWMAVLFGGLRFAILVIAILSIVIVWRTLSREK